LSLKGSRAHHSAVSAVVLQVLGWSDVGEGWGRLVPPKLDLWSRASGMGLVPGESTFVSAAWAL
jgi:hypothetical protein